MEQFEIIPFVKENGSVPVFEFIEAQNPKMTAKIYGEIDLLQVQGFNLDTKHSKHLDDGIFELRIQFSNDISRVLYFFHTGKKIVLTNGFIKKTRKTPPEEIKRAKRYRNEFLKREKEKSS